MDEDLPTLEARLRDVAARSKRFIAWTDAVFDEVAVLMKDPTTSRGANRIYGNFHIWYDVQDESGFVIFCVLPVVGVNGLVARAAWEEHEPAAVAARIIEMIEQIKTDPIYKIMNRSSR